ncbi:hypothetical protein B0T21DRAFT_412546 [Apiosordaria backusii]|uniref:Uncharacterized protein n=1 Tax=Apiosordaria backusii TaxID=314023 RepID=A0AA40ECH5_9PEZI|nr:hypothetical protein B0T21DRAFT_412546 [Apiosordaria backusii]
MSGAGRRGVSLTAKMVSLDAMAWDNIGPTARSHRGFVSGPGRKQNVLFALIGGYLGSGSEAGVVPPQPLPQEATVVTSTCLDPQAVAEISSILMKRSAGRKLELEKVSRTQPTAADKQINPSMRGNVAVRPVGRQLIRRNECDGHNRQVDS